MEWTGEWFWKNAENRREEDGEDKEAAKLRVCGTPHLQVILTSLFPPEFQQRQLLKRHTNPKITISPN